MLKDKDLISIQQARGLIERAHRAAEVLKEFSQSQIDTVVEAMALSARREARRLAELAVSETGYGNARDKTIKNLFSAVDVFEYVRGLKTCGVISENREKRVIDIAVPVGVIAAIIPTTNPTSTAIFKILCALKGRNSIVISPHPNAKECTIETARIMARAARKAGAPEDCIGWMDEITIGGTTELMKHRNTDLILATGGAGLVKAAYSSGKPAFGVGPGNVPAYIESSADVTKAVADVIAGKSFDYGVLCSSEQSLIYDRSVEQQVLTQLKANHAYLAEGSELQKLKDLIQRADGRLNTRIVGKSPQAVAKMAGFSVPGETRCLVGREEGVGREYPLSMEKLSPVLALYSVQDWKEGCDVCIKILQFGGLGHTMSIHSTNRDIIMQFGLHKPAYRVCVNTPATMGSVGLTTGVPPSMTLGCGTPGGNITSDNITPMHLINVRRVAFETRSVGQIAYPELEAAQDRTVSFPGPAPEREEVRAVVRSVVEDYLTEKKRSVRSEVPANPIESERVAPPAEKLPLSAEPEIAPPLEQPAVDFVSEEHVRRALRNNEKIWINDKTIITPAARDLASGRAVLVLESRK